MVVGPLVTDIDGGAPARSFRRCLFEHANSFSPEQLDAMTTALQAAVSELDGIVTENIAREMAQRILACAAEGVFNVEILKAAALGAADGQATH